MQWSFGPYYTFFSIHLQQLDYSKTAVGWLWALGVFAEVLMFLFMHRLLPALGARRLLLCCFGLTVLRWWLIAYYADQLGWLLSAQCLHAFSFGMFHAVMIDQIHRSFPNNYQGRGQALYSAVSFGAGGALGAFCSGYSWTHLGATTTFVLAAAVAFLGLVTVWWEYIATAVPESSLATR